MKKINKGRAVFLGVFAAAAIMAVSITAYRAGAVDAKVTYTSLVDTSVKDEEVVVPGNNPLLNYTGRDADDVVFSKNAAGEVKLLTGASVINADVDAYYLPKATFDGLVAEHKAGVSGTGDITWFIYGEDMYVLGTGDTAAPGTLQIKPKEAASGNPVFCYYLDAGKNNNTMEWSEPLKADLTAVSAEYGDIEGEGYGVGLPAIGDEKTMDGFYSYTARANATEVEIADPTTDIGAAVEVKPDIYCSASQINYVDAADHDYDGVPWMNAEVGNVKKAYIGSDVELKGNMSYLFNMNTDANLKADIGTQHYDGVQRESKFSKLEKIYFNADTSAVTYAAGMFARIPNLTEIKTARATVDFNQAKTTSLMFFGDEELTNGEGSLVDAIDLTTNAVLVDTSWMFAGCSTISKPNVKDYKMDLVQTAEGMFLGAKSAQLDFDTADNSNIGDWNLSSLVDAKAMFSGVTYTAPTEAKKPFGKNPGYGELSADKFGKVVVGAVDLTKWDANGLTNLKVANCMFALNDGITSVKLPEGPLTALVDASEIFVRNDNLTSITGNNVNAQNLKYLQYALMGSGTNTATADISLIAPHLENIGFAFYKSGFAQIDLTGGTTNYGDMTKAFAAFADMPNVTKIDLGDKAFLGLTDGQYMFYNDPKLTNLAADAANNGSTFDMRALQNGSFMFTNDTALKKLTLTTNTSAWKLESAGTNLENFIYNSGVDAIDLSGVTAGNHITNLSLAFANAPNLKTVKLPADGFPNATNAFGAFSDDPALTTITGVLSLPLAKDVRGMFANDTALTSEGVLSGPGKFIAGPTEYASYMFKNCPRLTTVNLSQITPTNLKYAQGMFDGDTGLSAVTVGDYDDMLPAAKSMGAMFRNTALDQASFTAILGKLSVMPIDCYAAFEGNRDVKTADLSRLNFTNTTDISRMFANCDRLGVISADDVKSLSDTLSKIKVSTTFGINVANADNRKNVFYVQYDKDANALNPDKADDDVLTYLVSSGGTMPDMLKSYPFTKDNRKFASLVSRTINNKDIGTYTYGTDDTDPVLKVTVKSSAMTTSGGEEEPLALAYAWSLKKPDGTVTDLGENDSDYIAPKEEYGDGKTYVVTASYKPAVLTGITEGSAPFVLNAKTASIEATYDGDPVPIGKNYDKDKVTVNIVLTDGEKIPIDSTLWKPDSTKITQPGDNTFKATYTEDGKNYVAEFTVPGVRLIDRIETTYSGPSVLVGDTWKEANVETVGYYADDVHKIEGIPITPTYYSGKLIKTVGTNTFTATYVDPAQDGKTFSSTFEVPGYKEIGYMKADYTGPAVKVGTDYEKADVRVTVYYADGSGSNDLKPKDWTADSLTVQEEGDNSFTATYRDPFGTTFTAGYAVKGVKSDVPASSSGNTSGTATSSDPTGRPDTGEPSSYADLTNTYSGYVDNPSAKQTGTTGVSSYTGRVQTGNMVMVVLYILAFAGAAAAILAAIVIKRRNKKEKD